jgi:zinc transporter ZupT
MIDFLAGAAALGYALAAVFFLRFWRTTRDRLFLAFCAGFMLLAANQVLAALLEAGDERTAFVYGLRVLGFLLILWAIVDKNLSTSRSR